MVLVLPQEVAPFPHMQTHDCACEGNAGRPVSAAAHLIGRVSHTLWVSWSFIALDLSSISRILSSTLSPCKGRKDERRVSIAHAAGAGEDNA